MQEPLNILITLPREFYHADEYTQRLRDSAPGASFTFCRPEEVTRELAAAADVWVGNPSLSALGMSRRLKLLQLLTSGADPYFKKPELFPEGMLLTCATGAYGLTMSEYALGVILSMMRNLHLYRDNQNKRLWHQFGAVDRLSGSTALILGVGDVGKTLARALKPLGVHIIGVRRSAGQKPDDMDEIYPIGELDSLLPRADVVALCLPGTAETKKMFDARRLGLLKPGAYLVNMGRGDTVDCLALAEVLHSGHLAGAALDVTDPEPLPSDHPLWLEPRALITPHVSGRHNTALSSGIVIDIVVDNLARFAAGKPLRNVVDIQSGYVLPE